MKQRKEGSTRKGETRPEEVILPPPLELAKLAALSDKDFADSCMPELAINKAVKLYLHAIKFCKQHRNATVEELADAVGDTSTWLELSLAKQGFNRELRLEVDKPKDEVRRYLAANGVHLKTAKRVLDNIEEFLRFSTARQLVKMKAQASNVAPGMTQKEEDEVLWRQAIELGLVTFDEWNQFWRRQVQSSLVKGTGDREVHAFNEGFLLNLLAWKKARKRSGGVRSIQTAAGENPQNSS